MATADPVHNFQEVRASPTSVLDHEEDDAPVGVPLGYEPEDIDDGQDAHPRDDVPTPGPSPVHEKRRKAE